MGRRWGQHFLRSEKVVSDILDAESLRGRTVVEIGPGEGVLTGSLCQRAVRVHAFEIDPKLATNLRGQPWTNLSVHEGDFLKADKDLLEIQSNSEEIVVVANLPYYITAPILERLFWQRPLRLEAAVLMMQKEVALRISGPASRHAGALTYIVGAHFDVEYLFDVGPECFEPPPKVDSAVVKVVPRRPDHQISGSTSGFYERLVKAAFQTRRKQLARSLKVIEPNIREILDEVGVDATRRPETLTVQEFWTLARNLENRD